MRRVMVSGASEEGAWRLHRDTGDQIDAVASGGEREVTGHESSTLCRNPYVEEVAELEPRHVDIAAHDDVGHSAAAALRGAVLTPLALHGHAAEHAPLGGADGVGADGGAGGGAV